MIKKILLFGIILLHFAFAQAQVDMPLRIEVSDNNVDESIGIPLESKHFLVINHQQKRASMGEHWLLEIYDSNFKKLGQNEMFLPREFRLFSHKTQSDSIVWICFAEPNGKHGSMMLYKLNLKTRKMAHAYFKGDRKAQLNSIEVLNNKVFIIGTEMEALIEQLADLNLSKDFEVQFADIPERSQILATKSDKTNQRIVIMLNIQKGNPTGLHYFEYSGDSASLKKTSLSEVNNINLIDGSLSENAEGDLLFMGTYNTDVGRLPSKELIRVEGTYIGKISDGNFEFFKTNKFSDFTNAYATLAYRDQVKVKEKQEKGKEVNLEFRLLVHKKSIKQGDLYILSLESYYLEYHYESNFDSRGYMYQMEVFDGYRTTNSIVAAFNGKGELVWDNYMKINEIRDYYLQENVLVFGEEDGSIIMAYYNDGEIKSKVVKGNEVVFKKSEDKIETVPGENVISESTGQLSEWYDNYFVLSGYQIIIGKNSRKRKVFFYNMISFE
jgi:sporulation protein YlmC with PRC-barrel domain